jgi:hypothetical protein
MLRKVASSVGARDNILHNYYHQKHSVNYKELEAYPVYDQDASDKGAGHVSADRSHDAASTCMCPERRLKGRQEVYPC